MTTGNHVADAGEPIVRRETLEYRETYYTYEDAIMLATVIDELADLKALKVVLIEELDEPETEQLETALRQAEHAVDECIDALANLERILRAGEQ